MILMGFIIYDLVSLTYQPIITGLDENEMFKPMAFSLMKASDPPFRPKNYFSIN